MVSRPPICNLKKYAWLEKISDDIQINGIIA